jgi:uncharacterized membrane protein HdeD (DUF308 family)
METTGSLQTVKTAYNLMRVTFGIVPIVAGIDKFANLLTHWGDYVNPTIAGMLPVSPETFMMIVGVIEITAGLIVLFRPSIGAYIVSAWLVLIGLTLLVGGKFIDVAVRDFVMAIAAFGLARMAKFFDSVNYKRIA